MSFKSLRIRLLAAAILSIAGALLLAGFGLVELFERHVERRVSAELTTYIHQIAGNLNFGESDSVSLTGALADPRFERALSGLYWQIRDESTGFTLRSRSLWDYVLPIPPDELTTGIVHSHLLPGPDGGVLTVQERIVVYERAAGERLIRIAVALDRRDIEKAGEKFAGEVAPALLLLAVVLAGAAWVQVSVGLRPLEGVRRGVSAVRSQRQQRLRGNFPDEVMPLVLEVNELLDAQDRSMERARARAGDLAHGLKTPLTVLTADARKLREKGEAGFADEIEDLARFMQRHIDRELARTRIAYESGRRRREANLAAIVGGLVATLRRTPAGEALDWTLAVPENLVVMADPADLTEAIGNLLENAAKWARSIVRVTAGREGDAVVLRIRDDGEGIPEKQISALGQRGARLDEQVPGTGLGLAIAKDILDAYEGTLDLRNEPEGGLTATVRLGVAQTAPAGGRAGEA